MRNLKKVLSLTLALVMLLGMMVVGAGAATTFPDDSKINNKVAVAVANKINVLLGDEKGNFNPEDTLTRAEAAVVIAKLDLGASAASALTATNAATFNDVPAGHWGKPYIDYCAGNGYIVGDDQGNFLPSKAVTSVEFSLMVARMLGYRDKNEGLDGGSDWAVKAIALARKAGLGTGVTLNSDGMSRDSMAQMVLNTLTASMVEYEGLDITIGDVAITSKAKVRTHTGSSSLGVYNTTYDGDVIKSNITPIRLCEEKFPDLRLKRDSLDAFGHEYSVWTWKRVDIEGSDSEIAPDTYYYKKTSASTIKADINDAKGYSDSTIYINGKEYTGSFDSSLIADLTAKGRLVQVYLYEDNNKAVKKVVVTDTYVAKVNSVSKAGTDDRYVTLVTQDKTDNGPQTPAINAKGEVTSAKLSKLDKTFETDKFSAGDLVTYTAAWNDDDEVYEIQSLTALEVSATATLEKWVGSDLTSDSDKGTASSNFTADGTKYEYSVNDAIVDQYGNRVSIHEFSAGKSEINIYRDEYNYVIYVSGVEAMKNYAAVIGVGKSNQYGSETRGATLLLPDGTQKEVKAKLSGGISWTYLAGIDANGNAGKLKKDGSVYENLVSDGVADIVTYNEGSDGIYTLTLVGKTTDPAVYTGQYYKVPELAKSVDFVKGRSQIEIAGNGSLYTTSRTIFMIGVPDGNESYAYSVFTGYAAAPTIKKADVTGVSYGTNAKYEKQIDVVYIHANKNITGISVDQTFFVFNSDKFEITTDGTNKFYTLPAIVGSETEVGSIKIDAALAKAWNGGTDKSLRDASKGLYVIKNVKKDKNDVITDCTLVTDAFNAVNGSPVGTIGPNGVVLGFGKVNNGDKYFAYGSSTKVYTIDKDYTSIDASTVDAVPTDTNDIGYASWNTGSTQLKNVFIVDVPEGTVSGTVKPTDPSAREKTYIDGDLVHVALVDRAASNAAVRVVAATALRDAGYTPSSYNINDAGSPVGTETIAGTIECSDGSYFVVEYINFWTLKVDGTIVDYIKHGTTGDYTWGEVFDKITSANKSIGTGVLRTIATTPTPACAYQVYGNSNNTTKVLSGTTATAPVTVKSGYVKIDTQNYTATNSVGGWTLSDNVVSATGGDVIKAGETLTATFTTIQNVVDPGEEATIGITATGSGADKKPGNTSTTEVKGTAVDGKDTLTKDNLNAANNKLSFTFDTTGWNSNVTLTSSYTAVAAKVAITAPSAPSAHNNITIEASSIKLDKTSARPSDEDVVLTFTVKIGDVSGADAKVTVTPTNVTGSKNFVRDTIPADVSGISTTATELKIAQGDYRDAEGNAKEITVSYRFRVSAASTITLVIEADGG